MNIKLNSRNYQVIINTLGAELKSFCTPSVKEFVWNSDPTYWMRSSPLLFPTVGNVRDNKTIINNIEFSMPKHGFCKESEFSVLAQTENSATFLLKANEETRKYYPYAFELQLTYQLSENCLSMTYQVRNSDDCTMFYHIGAHPGFMCPLELGESLSDYEIKFEKEECLIATVYDTKNLCFSSTKTHTFSPKSTVLPLSTKMFDDDAVLFRHTNSRAVSLIHSVTGKGIHMAYPDFSSIAFWTPAGGKAPFLCLEPWNGAGIFDDEDNIFCHKRDIEALASKEERTYHLEISLIGY